MDGITEDLSYEAPKDPGAPLTPLPGHSSRGRLERVLRAGHFAVTAELSPPRLDELIARGRKQPAFRRSAAVVTRPAYALQEGRETSR